jgi:hypothetical protein
MSSDMRGPPFSFPPLYKLLENRSNCDSMQEIVHNLVLWGTGSAHFFSQTGSQTDLSLACQSSPGLLCHVSHGQPHAEGMGASSLWTCSWRQTQQGRGNESLEVKPCSFSDKGSNLLHPLNRLLTGERRWFLAKHMVVRSRSCWSFSTC